jgi:hypothetical protein
MILDCLVSLYAGNETMIPSLGSPRAPFAGPPSIALPLDGVGWWYVCPDVLEDVTIILDGARISNAGPDVLEDVTILDGARISNAG